MRDLGPEIRRYYESVVERVDPHVQPVGASRPIEHSVRKRVAVGVLAAIVALIVFGLVPALLSPNPEVSDSPIPTPIPPATTTTEPQTEGSVETTVPETEPQDLSALPPPPWDGPFLSPEEVDPLLLDDWSRAANRGYCTLLAPADLGPEGEDAKAREAGFERDLDWYVAWDNPDGPGMTGESRPCEDCGRSAFGIHGIDLFTDGEPVSWNDGSGLSLHVSEDISYADGHGRALANLSVAGQPCAYQVWSSFGEEHLRWFIDQLRFVEGHYSEPIEPGIDVTIVELGVPGWIGPPLSADEVDTLLLRRSEDVDQSQCPSMALADLGPGAEDALIRAANFGPWGVAWDNPGGPGHDASNWPCSDCGRGVVGLGGGGGYIEEVPGDRPFRVEWDDGSRAVYGYEWNEYNLIPPERIDLRDPDTGEPVTPRLHAWIQTADQPDCLYEIWTHLGEEHLQYLLTQLRYVEDRP